MKLYLRPSAFGSNLSTTSRIKRYQLLQRTKDNVVVGILCCPLPLSHTPNHVVSLMGFPDGKQVKVAVCPDTSGGLRVRRLPPRVFNDGFLARTGGGSSGVLPPDVVHDGSVRAKS